MLDILIPAYNCSATLGNALQSLVDQKTTETFHVIVYDDASTENLQEIVQEFSDKLDITYIRGEFNRGVGAVRQQLIVNSIAPFFTFLDADDIVHPNFVSTFYFLANNGNSQGCDIFVTDFIEMRADGSSKIMKYPNNKYFTHGKFFKHSLINKYNITSEEDIVLTDDTCFTLKCLEMGQVFYLPETTMTWNYVEGSMSRRDLTQIYRPNMMKTVYNILSFLLQYKTLDEIQCYYELMNRVKRIMKTDLSDLTPENQNTVKIYYSKISLLTMTAKKRKLKFPFSF